VFHGGSLNPQNPPRNPHGHGISPIPNSPEILAREGDFWGPGGVPRREEFRGSEGVPEMGPKKWGLGIPVTRRHLCTPYPPGVARQKKSSGVFNSSFVGIKSLAGIFFDGGNGFWDPKEKKSPPKNFL